MSEVFLVPSAIDPNSPNFSSSVQILDAVPHLTWIAAANGDVIYYNQKMYEFTGVPRGSAQLAEWTEVVHEDDREQSSALWRKAVENLTPYIAIYRVRHVSGSYRWTIARANPVLGETGKVVMWVGTNSDIHDQHLAALALQEDDRHKNDFLAMLSHELRNPLSAIVSAVQLLEPWESMHPQIGILRDVLERQVGNLVTLVNDLSEASKVLRGEPILEKRPVDIGEVVCEAVEQARPALDIKNQRLVFQSPSQSLSTLGDRQKLVQVVSNLLDNASKYTQEGGIVEVEIRESADNVELSVRDNGVGMTEEALRNAFELFYQTGKPAKSGVAGLGIGLALVKRLVEQHQGRVEASSDGPGKGSRITVLLPKCAVS